MASPFAAQLGTNYCPKDEDVLKIKSHLVEPTQRLRRLDEMIADLQKTIDKLVEERDGLGIYVDAHKALISPARRLPLDIVQEIFVACLPTHRNCVMSASEAPVLLGRICSSWRAISLTTPRLWARLHVVEPQSDMNPHAPTAYFDEKVAQRVQATKMWLGRSGQCPLSISLLCALRKTEASVQFLQALISFAPRWQHIHLIAAASLLLEIASSINTEIPWLETIAFRVHLPLVIHGSNWGDFNILRGARVSSLSIPDIVFIPERLPVHWDQLTTLSIGGPKWTSRSVAMTSEAMWCIFSRCSALRRCKLVVNDRDETPMLQHPIVELPFLHTLVLHCNAREAPADLVLLKHLSFPKLRHFKSIGTSQLENSPILRDFFTNSICMESLTIDTNIFRNPRFIETLAGLPPIRRLMIRDTGGPGRGRLPLVDDDALTVLMSPALCPALQELYMDCRDTISDATVLRFISARMQNPRTTLKRVDIRFGRPMTIDIMPSLRTFIESGLEVSLIYSSSRSKSSPWKGLVDAPADVYDWGPPPQINLTDYDF
ncbi:hypothetical protein DFH08DRAFT_855059 [Mycena albidolilacea]|uniref:F-box domain-containing protein n=1 Tax=Mycena albidolilacea TaxID=1033008 RepID=A0AAD7ACX2_9AGAR|nr:hypothetical protein DFH08DRAFT_855059 [Mycena albidolilacea]